MLIQEMSREACFAHLGQRRLARLACVHEGQPYIVPIYCVHDRPTADEDYLYSFSTVGQKIEWMRANPLVCVEFDEYDTETFKTVDHGVTSAGIGRSAWFKDPDGNTIAVFQPE